MTDPRTVQLDLTNRDPIETLEVIENLRVEPDNAAIVIIDEASGTIVMGANVRISTVAIAQGNLTIRVTETPEGEPAGAVFQDRDHHDGAPNPNRNRRSARQEAGYPALRRHPARTRRQLECPGCRTARSDQHPAVDQRPRAPCRPICRCADGQASHPSNRRSAARSPAAGAPGPHAAGTRR